MKSFSERAIPIVTVFALLAFTMWSIHPVAADASNSFTTANWAITYSLSSSIAQPQSSLTLNIEIHVTKASYDFDLWINPEAPLSVQSGGSNNNHLHYDQLTPGDARLASFSIVVPGTVSIGESYALNIMAQSYSGVLATIPPVGQIPNSFNPDAQFDTSKNPSKSIFIEITGIPKLSIQGTENPSTHTLGDYFVITFTIANTGTGDSPLTYLFVSTSPGLKLDSLFGFTNGTNMKHGQTTQVTLNLQATGVGDQVVQANLFSGSSQLATQAFSVKVNEPLTTTMWSTLYQYWWVIGIVVLIVLALIVVAFLSAAS